MNKPPFVQVYLGRDGWRWRAVAANSRNVASPGEPFYSKWNAKRAAKKEAKARGWPMVVQGE